MPVAYKKKTIKVHFVPYLNSIVSLHFVDTQMRACLFQALDGQHLVLHPLNMKCLLHHYGSYDMLPHRFVELIYY